jgi:hypothetical protein
MREGYVEYDSNNSGGYWWLKDEDWFALEAAGWEVRWVKDRTSEHDFFSGDENGRWLGALATSAVRRGLSLRDAADEWERVTGQCSTDAGCPCCGQPHNFTEYDAEGKYISSGPDIHYEASW